METIAKLSSTKDVRHMLLNCITAVAHGEMKPVDAKAICNLSQQIYNTVNIELKFALAKQELGDTKIESIDLR